MLILKYFQSSLCLKSIVLRLRNHCEAGFSLLEVSLTLAIMGIIMGLAIPPLLSMLTLGKIKKTQQHQEIVMAALASYGLQHGYLPAPISPHHNTLPSYTQDPKCEGWIPHHTLGIPMEFAYDGFHKPMIYIVNAALIESAPASTLLSTSRDHQKVSNYQPGQAIQQLKDPLPPRVKQTIPQEIPVNSWESKAISSLTQGVSSKQLCDNVTLFCSSKFGTDGIKIYDSHHRIVMTNTNDNFIAVVLISEGESRNTKVISHESSAKTAHTTLPTYLMDKPYSKAYPYISRWISRDLLAQHYAQHSCINNRINSALLLSPLTK